MTEQRAPSEAELHKTIRLLIDNLVNIKDETGEFLLKLEDGRVIDTKGWNDWEWTHGIGLYGLWRYYEITNDSSVLNIIESWFRDRFASGGTTKNINTMSVFLTLAYVYEKTRNPEWLAHLNEWAEWAYNDLERTQYGGMQHVTYLTPNTEQLWDDTLMMTTLPLARIGIVLNRPHYVIEAKKQFLMHIEYLRDHTTGLFFHGWQFTPDSKNGKIGHNFANALWARGNSWLTIVLPEFIELLKEDIKDGSVDESLTNYLADILDSQVKALLRVQDSQSGLWRTILDDVDADNYLESSASAGFTFGMLKGLRKGYLASDKGYAEAALKALNGVIGKVDAKGELQGTSFGTPVFDTKDEYKKIPITSMPYGQAMAMLCCVEFLTDISLSKQKKTNGV